MWALPVAGVCVCVCAAAALFNEVSEGCGPTNANVSKYKTRTTTSGKGQNKQVGMCWITFRCIFPQKSHVFFFLLDQSYELSKVHTGKSCSFLKCALCNNIKWQKLKVCFKSCFNNLLLCFLEARIKYLIRIWNCVLINSNSKKL